MPRLAEFMLSGRPREPRSQSEFGVRPDADKPERSRIRLCCVTDPGIRRAGASGSGMLSEGWKGLRRCGEGQGDEGSPAYGRSPTLRSAGAWIQAAAGMRGDQVAGSMPCFFSIAIQRGALRLTIIAS